MINPLKSAAPIALSIFVLWIISFGLLRDVKPVSEVHKTIIVDTLMTPISINVSLRDSIVNFGMKLLGTPYVAGACSKNGFDCSGFVYYVFQNFKIQVPRSTSEYNNFGNEIPVDSVRKGDILVFLSPTRNVIGHVGIVTNPKGKESDFIHASSGSEMKVKISSLKQEGYKVRFVKALDVL
jgi:cell wall-associated NlpC family hydrolase